MLASDIMTRTVFTASLRTSVQEVAQLLYQERISGVPVIDDNCHIIGMVTEADIIKNIHRDDLLVADIMSRQVVTVDVNAPVSEIAALLNERKVKRVPVLQDGKVVGIVSRADIVQAVAMGNLVIRQW